MNSYLLTFFKSILLTLLLVGINQAQAQIFWGDYTGAVTAECSDGPLEVNVNVSGIGILGEDNLGIVEVFVDLTVGSGFLVDLVLEAPNGDEFILAASSLGSYPGWTGFYHSIAYIPCPDLPTPQDSWSSLWYTDGQPEEDFSVLNDQGINADGNWKIKICNDNLQASYFSELYSSRITFGNICPEVTNVYYASAGPECPDDLSQVYIEVEDGICQASTVSDDNGNSTSTGFEVIDMWVGTGDNNFYAEDDYGCTGPGFEFNLDPIDLEYPVFSNLPDLTIYAWVTEGTCSAEVSIVDPNYSDNCGIVSAIGTLEDVNGTISTFALEEGMSFDYILGVGNSYLTFTIEDAYGNITTYTTTIQVIDPIPPVAANPLVNIYIECGDPYDGDPTPWLDNFLLSDNCSSVEEISLSLIDSYTTQNCGSSFTDTWIYEFYDANGNFNYDTNLELNIIVQDNQGPTITGVPTEPIIFDCGDDFLPYFPIIGVDVFADDYCEGDLTSSIEESITLVANDCNDGTGIIEIETHTFLVSDGCGATSEISYEVHITDLLQPTWLAPFEAPMLITGECGVDDLQEIIDAYIPIAGTCNGEIEGIETANEFSEECLGSASGTTFIDYESTSDCGVSAFTSLVVELLDTQAPVISGQLPDVIIQCGDEFPAAPILSSMDACNGDVTDLIELTITSSTDDCDANIVETYTYLYTASDYCGNSASYAWSVAIENDFSIELGDDVILCDEPEYLITAAEGNSYLWSTGETTQSIVVNTTAIYSVVVYSNNGCCAEDDIAISFESGTPVTAEGGELDCEGGAISLFAASGPTSTYAWTGPGGFTSDLQNPMVSQAGTYTVTATNELGCSSMATAEVTTDTNVPSLSTTGGVLDCNNSTVTLSASSDTEDVSFAWSGPDGFTSDQESIEVDVAGDYMVTIMAPNGCIATGLAVASENLELPDLSAIGGSLSCNTNETLISASSADLVTYAWSGPNGFTSDLAEPTVSEAGDYTVIATGENGCSTELVVNVFFDGAEPDLSASGAELNCQNNVVTIEASSADENVSFMWSGPDGFESNIPNPQVTMVGSYTVTATGENGCTTSLDVEVSTDDSVPSFDLSANNINCLEPTSIIIVNIDTEEVEFTWSGPNGFTSDEKDIQVSEAGTYSLEVNSANGCSFSDFIIIEEDFTIPSVILFDGQITCANPSIILEAITDEGVSYLWSGPNGFSSDEASPTTSESGLYTLSVTAANGCSNEASLTVEDNTQEPEVIVTGGTLNCENLTTEIYGETNVENAMFSWIGPNGFSSIDPSPIVTEAGLYTLEVTAPNGCTNDAMTEVTSEMELPIFEANGVTLNCTNPVNNISVNSDEQISIRWTGPNGFTSIDANPLVQTPGIYTVEVTGENGCITTEDVMVVGDFDEPVFSLEATIIDCFDGLADVTTMIEDQEGLWYEWTGPNDFIAPDKDIQVSESGVYTLTATAANGCTYTETIFVSDPPMVEATFDNTPTTLGSFSGSSTITITAGDGPFDIEWEDGQMGDFAEGLDDGRIEVYVTDAYGCTTTFETLIELVSSNSDEDIVNDWNVYPNPATDNLRVSLETAEFFEGSIFIYNTQGKRVFSQAVDNTNHLDINLDVSQLAPANYILQIVGSDVNISQQIMIIK